MHSGVSWDYGKFVELRIVVYHLYILYNRVLLEMHFVGSTNAITGSENYDGRHTGTGRLLSVLSQDEP